LTIAKTNGLATALAGKQDEINADDLAITDTAGLAIALSGKQATIEDGDLTIAKTNGLATALAGKQDEINADDLAITDTAGLAIALSGKQATIEDGDLTIAKTNGLQTALDNKYDDTGGSIGGSVNITGDLVVGTTKIIDNITILQQNNIIYNSNEYGLKAVSNWISQTAFSSIWTEVIYASELNLFVAISLSFSGNRIMTSSNGIDWENSISYPNTHLAEIAWSPKLSLFVVVFTSSPSVATSPDGKNWTTLPAEDIPFTNVIAVIWSAELELFVAISFNGSVMTSPDATTWTSRGNQLDGNQGQSLVWSKELNLLVAVSQSGTNRVATSSDGITWNTLPVSQNAWNDIEWSPALGLFVAVADSGTGNRVMTSNDGTIWTDGTKTDRSWETIRWSGGLGIFLAVAKDGYIAYSSDGFVWNESELTGTLRGCCWSPELGTFVVVGNNVVYTSSLKERKPTSDSIFNNEFNSINESGEWTFKSLSVGTTNIITEIGTKQATIEDGDLTIAKTSGLQTALDNKYNDTGGTINGNVDVTGDLVVGTTNIITELGTKQATIEDPTGTIDGRTTHLYYLYL